MAVFLSPVGGAAAQFFDNNGVILTGGKIYTYAAGSSTPQVTYTSSSGATAHSNPIILDASGRVPGGEIWLTENLSYKFLIKDANEVLIGTYDNLYGLSDVVLPIDSSMVTYDPPFAGSEPTNVEARLAQTVSVKDFGAVGDGVTDDYAAIEAAWTYCLANEKDLYFPAGAYNTKTVSFPIGRINGLIPASLLDCKNITVYGDGPATIFKTESVDGADVLQLNGAKNLHIRNLFITAVLASGATSSGSNAISVTSGYENLTFDNIWCQNLPSIDKTTYIDGGKGLTIQTPIAGQTLNCGTLKATNIFVKGCVYGFGLELDLVAASTMSTAISIDLVAEDCRDAVIVSAGAATAAIPANWTMGLQVNAQSINSMRDVVLSRAHGVNVQCQVITTKSKAARILNYNGVKWFATDTIADVVSLISTYAHDSNISMTGNKGECASIAQIGGISAGSSGLSAATETTQFYLDVLGVSASGDIVEVSSGGDTTQYCTFICQGTGTPSNAFYAAALNNVIISGNLYTLKDLNIQNSLKFVDADGFTSNHFQYLLSGTLTTRQTVGSSGSLIVEQWVNDVQATKFAIRNDGAIATAGRNTATSVATVKAVLPIYDEGNTLVGYVPVYTTYS
jgi:hypothetical protein